MLKSFTVGFGILYLLGTWACPLNAGAGSDPELSHLALNETFDNYRSREKSVDEFVNYFFSSASKEDLAFVQNLVKEHKTTQMPHLTKKDKTLSFHYGDHVATLTLASEDGKSFLLNGSPFTLGEKDSIARTFTRVRNLLSHGITYNHFSFLESTADADVFATMAQYLDDTSVAISGAAGDIAREFNAPLVIVKYIDKYQCSKFPGGNVSAIELKYLLYRKSIPANPQERNDPDSIFGHFNGCRWTYYKEIVDLRNKMHLSFNEGTDCTDRAAYARSTICKNIETLERCLDAIINAGSTYANDQSSVLKNDYNFQIEAKNIWTMRPKQSDDCNGFNLKNHDIAPSAR